MAELIHEGSARITSDEGQTYHPMVMGDRQPDGVWHGWIEFHPETGGTVLMTGRETTQANRSALEYWASGLEPIYFDGAFHRAEPLGKVAFVSNAE